MKRVLITGGSKGLGLAVAGVLAASGYGVITVSRSITEGLRNLAERYPGRIEAHELDVCDYESYQDFFSRIRLFDGLHGFVANAATGYARILTLGGVPDIRNCVEVNLTSVIVMARHVVKGMMHGGGSIVFISSVAAKNGTVGLSVYAAAKAGLLGFSRAVAREYGSRGIRANCVIPGYMDTDMTKSIDEHGRERIRRRTALGRLGCAGDVADCVKYLISDDSRFVTGAEIVADGGFSC